MVLTLFQNTVLYILQHVQEPAYKFLMWLKMLLMPLQGHQFLGDGDCSFFIKNKLKSEIFNDKKFINKNIFLSSLRI